MGLGTADDDRRRFGPGHEDVKGIAASVRIEVALQEEIWIQCKAVSGKGLADAGKTGVGPVVVLDEAGDHPEAPVPEGHQIVHQVLRGGGIVEADAVVFARIAGDPGQDVGNALLFDLAVDLGIPFGPYQQQAVDPAFQKVPDVDAFLLIVVFGAGDGDRIAGAADLLLKGFQRAAEEHVVEGRHDGADHAGAAGGEGPGRAIGHIAELLDRGLNPQALFRANALWPVDAARDRGWGDAGRLRDVLQGRNFASPHSESLSIAPLRRCVNRVFSTLPAF